MSDDKVNAYLAQMETMPADIQRRILLWFMEIERRRRAMVRKNYCTNASKSLYTPDFYGPGF